jgi:N-dimethylarginine dimethylaminohydrolase
MLAMAQHHAMLPSDGFVYEGDVIIVEGDWVYLTYKKCRNTKRSSQEASNHFLVHLVHHPWIRDVTVMDMGQDGALLVHDREDEWMDD